MNVGFSRRALRDLEEIFDYIAIDNPQAAQRVRKAILEAISLVASRPYLGIKNARAPNL
jgi:toxin ParE1/3/4